jgi:cyanophycinase
MSLVSSFTNNSAIMAIGGAEDKIRDRLILQAFCQRAGGENARIAIIPSASREPEAMGQVYKDIFTELGAKGVEVLLVTEQPQAEDPNLLALLAQATGVFMSGGDQLRLCSLLGESSLLKQLRQQVWQGQTVLAGTSAGAAVMGLEMIACGGSGEPPNSALIDLTVGLGFIPEVIVDQHFYNRNRLARLISAIAAHPSKLGIGVDEDTCALFETNGNVQVLGKGAVTVVDPGEVSYINHVEPGSSTPLSISNLRLHVLSQGDTYNLQTRQIVGTAQR